MTDTLSLKEFVSKTLIDLCEAVEEVREQKHYVSPLSHTISYSKDHATNVDFDIAVSVSNTATKGSEGKGGLSIGVMKMNVSVDAKQTNNQDHVNSSISRIKFTVPVYFQYDKEQHEKNKRQPNSMMMPTG